MMLSVIIVIGYDSVNVRHRDPCYFVGNQLIY